ncbi:hypothetical protein QBC37DRAFT_425472 [Rhypophila decipiens]|uniref:Cytochrome-b5 reductase n=1 Tax=Rhypophila decipiens TaxID=261697 RepID=A0AAN6Y3R9_9PEZI|nr:hypothetical protein QBC37DRAFT_425472 [Rhypophila decipiens]
MATMTTTTMLPAFTATQVAEHNTETNNWIIIQGQIYDVAKYIHDHPGGVEVLTEAAGTDASEAFDNAGHSDDALEIMAELLVGHLEGYQKPVPKRVVHLPQVETVSAPSPPPRSSIPSTTGAALALGSIAAISAVAARHSHTASTTTTAVAEQLLSHLPNTANGFPGGFLAASAISAATALVAVKQISSFTHMDHGFERFPMHKPASQQPPLPPKIWLKSKEFQPLPLIRKEQVAPMVFRLVFSLPTHDTILGLPTGQHVVIRTIIDGKPVMRSYTPISNNADKGVLELIIKCYPDGLLTGSYIASLQPDVDSVLFRGPKGAMKYHRGLAKEIGMIAGGTGITPMHQVIRAVCDDPQDHTRVSLVYANRSEGDILLRTELDSWAERFPEKLKVWYTVDHAPLSESEENKWEHGVGHINKGVLGKWMPKPPNGAEEESKVFLCGPPGMINAAKGMLGELGWEVPGASAKMEDQVFVF